jgi:hypothetical protein
MNPILATEVEVLEGLGWRVRSETESSVSLRTRSPFNWWIFFVGLLLSVGVGALIYVFYWLIFARSVVLLRVMQDGRIVMSGDTLLVAQQSDDFRWSIHFQRVEGAWLMVPEGTISTGGARDGPRPVLAYMGVRRPSQPAVPAIEPKAALPVYKTRAEKHA